VGGETSSVLDMCEVLDKRIKQDLTLPYIASWHDESHLNWFHSNYPQKLFPANFSGVTNYWTSDTSKSTLISLDKTALDIELGFQSWRI
jgi:hypothetical protein